MIRNLLSSFIVFFLLPSLSLFIFLSGLNQVVFNSQNFNRILDSNDTYNRIGSEILPAFLLESTKNSRGANNEGLPPEILAKLFTSEEIKTSLSKDLKILVIDSHSYLIGQKATLNTRIDLTNYTNNLKTNLIPSAKAYLEGLPACSAEQEQEYLKTEEKALPVCKLSKVSVDTVIKNAEIDKMQAEFANFAPTALILTEEKLSFEPEINLFNQNNEKVTPEGENQKISLKNIKNIVGFSLGAEYLLLTGIIFMTILLFVSRLKNFSSGLNWVSYVFFIASIPFLIFSSLVIYLIDKEKISQAILSQNDSPLGKAAFPLLSDLTIDLLQEISKAVQIRSLIFLIIGAVCFGTAFFLIRKKESHLSKITEKTKVKFTS